VYARFPLQAEYLSSLPIAGRDGTIRWRMEGTEAAGRLRAKTGTLENVTSLSGYVENAAHQVLAFSILVNDYPGRHAQVVRAVDALGGAMAASGGAPGAPGAIAAAVALAKAPEAARTPVTPAALAQAVGTWYALGRAADPRNVAALSDALRAQADPALRLAIAESMYLSDPGSETARHGFLEAISADPQVMGRLWFAAAGGTTPVLPSLGDVAAEGAPDALAKLVELAPAAALDGRLAAAIADTLAEVAASAPSELVDALRAAPPATADAALGALGTGLARSDEADHPFPAALRALGAKKDALGAFARGLLPRLEQATRSAAAVQTAPTLVPASTAAPAR
jgi:serine-type D-Ala-D-Ala carboxypeptidase/endopeptidase (penicillin-binding protein 4)